MAFSDNLIRIRKKAGFSQKELAHRSGVSQQAISKLENGKSSPSEYTMRQLANALDIPITNLIEETDRNKSEAEDLLTQRIQWRIGKLSEPALIRLSDFLDGLETGQNLASSMHERQEQG